MSLLFFAVVQVYEKDIVMIKPLGFGACATVCRSFDRSTRRTHSLHSKVGNMQYATNQLLTPACISAMGKATHSAGYPFSVDTTSCYTYLCMQVHKGYHKQLRKFVAIKRVNITHQVGQIRVAGKPTL